MSRMKLFLKSVRFSLSLVYQSSGLLVFVYFLLSLLGSALGLLSTYALRFLLNALSSAQAAAPDALIWIAVYVILLVLTQGNEAFQNILYDSVFKKAEHQYECRLADKMSTLSLSVLDSSVGRDMTDDVRYARNTAVYLVYRLVKIISYACTFAAAFVVLFQFNFGFSLLFLVLTIPGIVMTFVFDKRADELRRRQAPDVRKFSYYRWMLTDAWPAKDVRMYDLTEPIKSRYEEVKKEYLAANRRLDKQKLYSLLFAEAVTRVGEVAFSVYVVYEAVLGRIGIGDVALYIGFAVTVAGAFTEMVSYAVFAWARTTAVMGRVFAFFEIESDRPVGKVPVSAFETLQFDNVCFKYPYTDKYILNGVSFTLHRGEKLSIVGVNGSGKSTIIKLLLGLYEIESGQILLNGLPMGDYDIRQVRKLFSALFQSFAQYPLSLRDNIALSDYDRAGQDAEIEAALKQGGVYEELQEKLENGLDSYMTRKFDDSGTELSKGQWQKIALSRAYFKNAQVLIFDEPSAALDAEAEDRIFQNFEAISEGRTGIMISHRISAARMADRIIVLDGGKITESGTHEELVAQGGLYARFYNLQKEKYTAGEGA